MTQDPLSAVLGVVQEEDESTVEFLVDGDIIAYRAAAATDGRFYKVIGVKAGPWYYKKEAVEYCNELGISVDMIEIDYKPEPVANALTIVKQMMSGIKSNLSGKFPNSKLVTYLTVDGNFRKEINPGYKSGRKGVRRPENLQGCKDYLMKHHGATWEYGLEADDLLTLRATALGLGKFVICSIDKDLKQMPGLHYDLVNDSIVEVTEEEARSNLWVQVISGDTTDSIYTPKGMGPAAGKKLFNNVNMDGVSDERLFEMCTQRYCQQMKLTLDHTDVLCYVQQTYDQVYLLRTEEEKVEALGLLEEK